MLCDCGTPPSSSTDTIESKLVVYNWYSLSLRAEACKESRLTMDDILLRFFEYIARRGVHLAARRRPAKMWWVEASRPWSCALRGGCAIRWTTAQVTSDHWQGSQTVFCCSVAIHKPMMQASQQQLAHVISDRSNNSRFSCRYQGFLQCSSSAVFSVYLCQSSDVAYFILS